MNTNKHELEQGGDRDRSRDGCATLFSLSLAIAGAIALLAAGAPQAFGSTLTMTNLTGLGVPDTNVVVSIQANTNTPTWANGRVTTIGLPSKWFPDSNGVVNIFQTTGNYVITGPTLGQGMLFRFADDSTNATAYPISGFDRYVTVYQTTVVNTNGGGSQGGAATNVFFLNSPGVVWSQSGGSNVANLQGAGIPPVAVATNDPLGRALGLMATFNDSTNAANAAAASQPLPSAHLSGVVPLAIVPRQVMTNATLWMFDGDSFTDDNWTGTNSNPLLPGRTNSWAWLLISNTPMAGTQIIYTNIALRGRLASTFSNNYAVYGRPLTNLALTRTYVILGGINDHLQGASTNAIYGYFTNVAALAHADGWRVGIGVQDWATITTGTNGQDWTNVCAMLRNMTNASYPFNADVLFDQALHHSEYSYIDGLHLTQPANQAFADAAYSVLFPTIGGYATKNGVNSAYIDSWVFNGLNIFGNILNVTNIYVNGMLLGHSGSTFYMNNNRLTSLEGPGAGWDWVNGSSYVMQLDGATGNLGVLGVITGNLAGATNLPVTGIAASVATNITAGSSSTNLLGTDASGHQVAVAWANLPTGGGGSTANTVQTNAQGFVPAAIGLTNAGNTIAGNGVGLTGLNASALGSGTVPLAVLPGGTVTNLVEPGQLFVATNGNDASGLMGRRDYPFATIKAAVLVASNSASPAVINLGVGTFGVTNLILSTNITLAGSGRSATFITMPYTFVSGSFGVQIAGDNVTLRDMTFGKNALTGTYYVPISPQRGTNVLIQNMNIYGDSDVFILAAGTSAGCSASVVNCTISSGFDTMYLSYTAVANWVIDGCTFNVAADPAFGDVANRAIYLGGGVNAVIKNCVVNVSNLTASVSAETAGLELNQGGPATTVQLAGSVFNMAGGGLTNRPVLVGWSAGAPTLYLHQLLNATNIAVVSGTVIQDTFPAAGLTGTLTAAQLPSSVVTNSSTGTVSTNPAVFGTLTLNGAAVATNIAASASSTNFLATDASGHQVAVPIGNLPGGNGGSPAAALTNGANVFTAANVFMQQVNFSNGLAAYGGISSSGAGTNQFGPTQFTNPIPGTAIAGLFLDANNNVVTGAVSQASSGGSLSVAFRASMTSQNLGVASSPSYMQDGAVQFNTALNQVQMPMGGHTFTNWFVNLPFPSINAGTNITFVINTNGVDSGYNVVCHGPFTAGSANVFSNTTSFLTVTPGTLVVVKATNNTAAGIAGFWIITSIQ
jgi:hypothetical protein